MCFSATASFVSAACLASAGIATLARNTSAPRRMFAAIPLLFAAQQGTEGLVWLTVGESSDVLAHRLAVALYLGIALVVWPTWLPFALRIVERSASRRRVLAVLLAAGGFVSTCACVRLLRWAPAATMAGHCLRYDYAGDSDALRHMYLLVYAVVAVGPFFISTTSLARTMGVTFALSLWAATLVQRGALTSIWCFFAAALSAIVFFAVGLEERRTTPQACPRRPVRLTAP